MVEQSGERLTLDDLRQVFGFDLPDLSANRAGRVSAAQVQRLRREINRRMWLVVGIVVPMELIVLAAVLYALRGEASGLALMVVSVSVLSLILSLVIFMISTRPMRMAAAQPQVVMVRGAAQAQVQSTQGYRSSSVFYYLLVDQQRVAITGRQYLRMKDAPGAYTVYYEPRTLKLLSIEPLDG